MGQKQKTERKRREQAGFEVPHSNWGWVGVGSELGRGWIGVGVGSWLGLGWG